MCLLYVVHPAGAVPDGVPLRAGLTGRGRPPYQQHQQVRAVPPCAALTPLPAPAAQAASASAQAALTIPACSTTAAAVPLPSARAALAPTQSTPAEPIAAYSSKPVTSLS